jgi:murein DD-endopeptidase MepM/ murein hydrolase activator NlpD
VPEGSRTPVLAAANGTVAEVGNNSGLGIHVTIDHGNGAKTVYAHLSSAAVGAGRAVNQGAIIGYTGCTGWCTGEHLHFEVRINDVAVDPILHLPRQ